MEDTPERSFTEIGTGRMDIDSIIRTSEVVGATWLLVEQDVCKRSALESVAVSYRNLKTKGYT
ncbi:hypothetical protein ACFO8Q_22065 [Effusibacillus consociatus]|uniref:Sugar phosphate isomerase/epimerase n=1 Tax=Effusibacillus consociatus TaxID=1117041 RepID=A0ABV9Q6Z8_9BACL